VTASSGDEYNYNYTNLDSGTYVWREYANDTSGEINQTDQWTYTVAKAEPTLALTLDGMGSNITVNTSDSVDIIGTFTGVSNYSTLSNLSIALVVWNIDDNTHPGGISCGGAGSHMPWNSELMTKLESDGHNVTYVFHQDSNNMNYDYSGYDLIILEHFCAQETVDNIIAPSIDLGILNSGKPFMFSAVYDNEFDFTTTDDDTYTTSTTHYVQNSSNHISGMEEEGSQLYLYENPGPGEVALTYLGCQVNSTETGQ